MKYPIMTISSFCTTGSGGTPTRANVGYYNDGTIPWVKSGELREEVIYDTEEKITALAVKESSAKLVPKGALLIAMYGATIGRIAELGVEGTTNQAICHIIPNKKIADKRYLYYGLRFKVPELIAQGAGGAQPNINQRIIRDTLIPLPPLDDQIRIAAVLTRAEKLIATRKASIKALDELLKSTFLEMFGDPVRNEKGWAKKRIDGIADTRLGKMRDKQFITGNHLKYYLGNSNVRWFSFDFDSLEQMDFDAVEQEKFSLQYGDLLICEGGEIGRCAIWKGAKQDLYFQKALHRVRVYKAAINQEYLAFVLYMYSLRNGFKNVGNKSTIAHLTGEKLKETSVPIPPLQLQNQFAAIAEKVEAQKANYTQNLTELENLYGSLSQRAFKGELDLSGVVTGRVLERHAFTSPVS